MNNIQSNTQVASSSSDTISASANSLQEKEISKDTESNITAKGILLRHMKQARLKNQLIDMR